MYEGPECIADGDRVIIAKVGVGAFVRKGVANGQCMGQARHSGKSHPRQREEVPYRGPPQIITDLIGGRISALNPGTNLALARKGKIRAIAVTSRTRAPFAPDLPTMAEAEFPDFEMVPWFGVFVPAGRLLFGNGV
jgi:tripartite-type tricarboxylate transporter receptor subunit TctC